MSQGSTTVMDALARLPLTSQLPSDVRSALAAIASERTFAAGESLCREGEAAGHLFLIVRGHVGLDMFVPGRGQVRVQTVGPGELVVWSAIMGHQQATATGIALTETNAIVLAGDELTNLCQRNHDVGFLVMRELARTISRRLVSTQLQLLDLFAGHSV